MINNISQESLDEILKLGAKSMIALQRQAPEGYRLQIAYQIWIWFDNNAKEYLENAASEYDSDTP